MKVLVTGGNGFIGRFVVQELLNRGHIPRILDCEELPPDHPVSILEPLMESRIEIVCENVCDVEAVREALVGVDAVVHLAAHVGVGESMYQPADYVRNNTYGTAVLLDEIIAKRDQIKKLVVASSMSVYGEGDYGCPICGLYVKPMIKSMNQEDRFDFVCPNHGGPITPMAVTEKSESNPKSIYAYTKRQQEEMCLLIGKTYKIPTLSMRFFNVYGPGQALGNPYTGAIAIFINRVLCGKQPMIYEDGNQLRDFIYVEDVARAVADAVDSKCVWVDGGQQIFNIASGHIRTILSVAEEICKLQYRYTNINVAQLKPYITGYQRAGDTRHCFGDISKAKNFLRWNPLVEFSDGLKRTFEWATNKSQRDDWGMAYEILEKRGLIEYG